MLFSLLFVYATIRLLDGQYVFTGSMGIELTAQEIEEYDIPLPAASDSPALMKLAKGYEIQHNGRLYALNSRSEFRLDINSIEMVRLLFTDLPITIVHPASPHNIYTGSALNLDLPEFRFKPIRLTPAATNPANALENDASTIEEGMHIPLLISTAHAVELSAGDRIFIRMVALGSKFGEENELNVEMRVGKELYPLRSLSAGGAEIERLPLYGPTSVYDPSYFWRVELTGDHHAEVVLEGPGWLYGHQETLLLLKSSPMGKK